MANATEEGREGGEKEGEKGREGGREEGRGGRRGEGGKGGRERERRQRRKKKNCQATGQGHADKRRGAGGRLEEWGKHSLVVLVYQDSRGRSSSRGAQVDRSNVSPQNCTGVGAPNGSAQKLQLL